MSRDNLFTKKLKKQILSINQSIESYFNKLNYFKSNYKKILLSKNNRVFLGIGVVVILTLSYFLVPTFYDKNLIQEELKNQISNKYGIDIKFNKKVKYRVLPKPHFFSDDLLVFQNKRKIAVSNNFKIFISINNFFSLDKIKTKDLIFNKTDFNIKKDDTSFFTKLLKTEPNENKIIIKDSNIFFRNLDDEVLFINKIKKSKFFYDAKNLKNILSSNNEIFNIPFKIIIKNDKFNKQLSTKFTSKKIRLSLINDIDYKKIVKTGLMEIIFINKDTSLSYEIKKNSLEFISDERKNEYKGNIDFKPFYLNSSFNYDGLSLKNLFNNDSILFEIINSEILKNKNLSANIALNIKDIINIDELNNLILKIGIEEGIINLSNSNVLWKNDLKITLKESLINYHNNEININGKIIVDIKNLDNFYRSFQVKKTNRKKIKEIQFDFVYNLNQQNISFDNIKIDKSSNTKLEKYVEDFNLKEKKIFNKITFKNFVSNFFGAYSG